MICMKRYLTAGLILFFIAFMSAASEYRKDSRLIIHVPPDEPTTVDGMDDHDSDTVNPGGDYDDSWNGNDTDWPDSPHTDHSDDESQDGQNGDGDSTTDNNDDDDPDTDVEDDTPSGGGPSDTQDDEHIDADDIFVLYNSEKLTQDQVPQHGSRDGLTASLAKNESEGMQFVIRPDADITGAKITVSDLRDARGNRISDVKIYRQHYIRISGGPKGLLAPGSYPDALIPIFDGSDGGFDNSESDIRANKNQGYWITITTTKNQPAGDYYGTVRFSYDQGEDITVPIHVTVWDFTLPDKSSAKTAFMLTNTDYYSQAGLSEYDTEVMYWEFFLKYRISSGYMPDRAGADAIKNFAASHPRITAFMLPLFDADSSAQSIASNSQNIRLAQAMADAGLSDTAYYISHRLPYSEISDAEALKLDEAASKLPGGIRYLAISSDPTLDLSAVCPSWDTVAARWRKDTVNDKVSAGCEVWWNGHVTDTSYPTYAINDYLQGIRIIHWMQKYYGISGEYYASSTLFGKYGSSRISGRNVWTDPYAISGSSAMAGDGYLAVPCKIGDGIVNRNMLAPTLRLEAIRDGIEDYEYLSILQRKYERIISEYGIQGVTAEDMLSAFYDALWSSASDYTTDSEEIQAVRDAVAQDILAEQDALIAVENGSNNSSKILKIYAPAGATVKVDGKTAAVTDRGSYSYASVMVRSAAGRLKTIEIPINGQTYLRLI